MNRELKLLGLPLVIVAASVALGILTTTSLPSHAGPNNAPTQAEAYAPTEAPQDEDKTYRKPRWMDQRLDWCFIWGRIWGNPLPVPFCGGLFSGGPPDFRADPIFGISERPGFGG